MRLPWTIWLYVLADLWRLLVLTTGVLLVVVSFAATVRYTADGRLGPVETLRFMLLSMLPMLQYALPFAAGFAATLSYHRMTQDNELTAAAASGVSHRALLIPALVSGLALAGGLEWLSGNIIPGYLKAMEQLVTRDAAKLVRMTFESGRPMEFPNNVTVHADRVIPLPHEEGSSAYQTLLLGGVFAIRTDDHGQLISEVSASQARAQFSMRAEPGSGGGTQSEARGSGTVSGVSDVALELSKATMYSRDAEGRMSAGSSGSQVFYWVVPGLFGDDPKYLTNAEMARVPEHPEMLDYIETRRRDVALHLAVRDTITAVDTALRMQGSAKLSMPVGQVLVLRAAGIRFRPNPDRWELVPRPGAGGRGIEADIYPPGPGGAPDVSAGPRLSASAGSIKDDIGKDTTDRKLSLTLELESVATRSRELERGGEHEVMKFTGLSPAADPLPGLLALSSRQLLDEVGRRTARAPDAFIADPASDLSRELKKLGHEVIGKRCERSATALACLVMVLAGALTAMRLGTSLPLTVYLWSFFPALLAVLTISGGQQMTRQVGFGGLAVLWGGVALLGVYTAMAFAAVRRH